MNIKTMTEFFKWCTIINIAVFALAVIMFFLAPGLVYKTQRWFVPLTAEVFNAVFYGFLALYKICILVFNLVPYVAMRIIAKP